MEEISAAMAAEVKAKINWDHSRENQGFGPREATVDLGFVHGTEMTTMIQA